MQALSIRTTFAFVGAVIAASMISAFVTFKLLKSNDAFKQSNYVSNTETTKSAPTEKHNFSSQKYNDDMQLDQNNLLKKLAKLDEKYVQLENHLRRLGTQNSGPAQEESQLAMSQEEQTQLAEQRHAANLNLMEATLYSEEIDENWSLNSETAVRESLEPLSEIFSVDSVECASTLCALHISANSDQNEAEVMQSFSRSIEWSGEMTMQFDLNSGKAIAYLAREGHALPISDN